MSQQEPKVRAIPVATSYHYYINGVIECIDDHMELIDLLQLASYHDTVYVHLNTPGGDLDACTHMVHSIVRSEATVVGCADGQVASAGSIIFFACSGWEVGDYCEFLLHDGAGGIGGKFNEAEKAIKSTKRRLTKLYNDIYGPYFTSAEIKRILNGQDMYLDSTEVTKRLETAIMLEGEPLDSSDTDA